MFGRHRTAPTLTRDDWAHIDKLIRDRVAKMSALDITSAVKDIFTPDIRSEMRDDILGRLYNDGELNGVIRALARDEGEDAAKTYIAHVLGWRLTIDVGETLGALDPTVPPLKDATP